MELKLVIFPDDVLTTPSQEITEITDEIKTLARAMCKKMYEEGGIGLAAPQVGFNVRMCVIDRMATQGIRLAPPMIFINPTIEKMTKPHELEEGCLSHPDEKYRTERFKHISVRTQDLAGRWSTIPANGLLSVCLQHEIDHLDGHTIRTKFIPGEEEEGE